MRASKGWFSDHSWLPRRYLENPKQTASKEAKNDKANPEAERTVYGGARQEQSSNRIGFAAKGAGLGQALSPVLCARGR